MGKPEQYVEYYLRDEGKRRGYLALKWECPGHAGVPDRIVIGHGQIVLVECKREKGGRLSAVQKMMIPRLQEYGADVRVISNRQAVNELFDELDARGAADG